MLVNEHIKKEDLLQGEAYMVNARNFSSAIWTGESFAGLRFKFGDYFIDHEYHWDDGPPHGTVKPIRLLT